jgi:hypothetical protein
MIGNTLPCQLARRHKCQLKRRMRGDQANQLHAGMPAGTDDADAFPVSVHA